MSKNKSFNNRIKELTEDSQDFAISYAPAHITGIFEIHDDYANPLKAGSNGLGMCIDKGVTTVIRTKESPAQAITVCLNDELVEARTTKAAVMNLIGNKNIKVEVYSYTQLPLSQGFGLSGAGALSTTIALNSALGLELEYSELVNAAHTAEIQNRSGLGDVVAQATGGVVLRNRPGGFNYGRVQQIEVEDYETEILVCVLGDELKTSNIISNQTYKDRINLSAKEQLKNIQPLVSSKKISLQEILKMSFEFASDARLMNNQVRRIATSIYDEGIGTASMIMLGNAIFAIGDISRLKAICERYRPFVCNIDQKRARIIK